jgi:hypothetical protein
VYFNLHSLLYVDLGGIVRFGSRVPPANHGILTNECMETFQKSSGSMQNYCGVSVGVVSEQETQTHSPLFAEVYESEGREETEQEQAELLDL